MSVAPTEPVAAARQPISESYCSAACAAAGAVPCEKMAKMCGYDYEGERYVSVGGYMLRCKPACVVACFGPYHIGMTGCIRQCLHGNDKPPPAGRTETPPPDSTPVSTDPGDSFGGTPQDSSGGSGDGSGGDSYGDFV